MSYYGHPFIIPSYAQQQQGVSGYDLADIHNEEQTALAYLASVQRRRQAAEAAQQLAQRERQRAAAERERAIRIAQQRQAQIEAAARRERAVREAAERERQRERAMQQALQQKRQQEVARAISAERHRQAMAAAAYQRALAQHRAQQGQQGKQQGQQRQLPSTTSQQQQQQQSQQYQQQRQQVGASSGAQHHPSAATAAALTAPGGPDDDDAGLEGINSLLGSMFGFNLAPGPEPATPQPPKRKPQQQKQQRQQPSTQQTSTSTQQPQQQGDAPLSLRQQIQQGEAARRQQQPQQQQQGQQGQQQRQGKGQEVQPMLGIEGEDGSVSFPPELNDLLAQMLGLQVGPAAPGETQRNDAGEVVGNAVEGLNELLGQYGLQFVPDDEADDAQQQQGQQTQAKGTHDAPSGLPAPNLSSKDATPSSQQQTSTQQQQQQTQQTQQQHDNSHLDPSAKPFQPKKKDQKKKTESKAPVTSTLDNYTDLPPFLRDLLGQMEFAIGQDEHPCSGVCGGACDGHTCGDECPCDDAAMEEAYRHAQDEAAAARQRGGAAYSGIPSGAAQPDSREAASNEKRAASIGSAAAQVARQYDQTGSTDVPLTDAARRVHDTDFQAHVPTQAEQIQQAARSEAKVAQIADSAAAAARELNSTGQTNVPMTQGARDHRAEVRAEQDKMTAEEKRESEYAATHPRAHTNQQHPDAGRQHEMAPAASAAAAGIASADNSRAVAHERAAAEQAARAAQQHRATGATDVPLTAAAQQQRNDQTAAQQAAQVARDHASGHTNVPLTGAAQIQQQDERAASQAAQAARDLHRSGHTNVPTTHAAQRAAEEERLAALERKKAKKDRQRQKRQALRQRAEQERAAHGAAAAGLDDLNSPDAQRALGQLKDIDDKFRHLNGEFKFPRQLNFGPSNADQTQPPLLFDRNNTPYHAQAHSLLQLLLECDGVQSEGNRAIRQKRKEMVRRIEDELQMLENERDRQWRIVKQRREEGESDEESDAESDSSWWYGGDGSSSAL